MTKQSSGITFERTAISIHRDTLTELEKKADLLGKNLSWVTDACLTRYFSLLKLTEDSITKEFSEQDLLSLSNALRNQSNTLRNRSIRNLSSFVHDLQLEKSLDWDLAERILKLIPLELACLIDKAEQKIKQRRR